MLVPTHIHPVPLKIESYFIEMERLIHDLIEYTLVDVVVRLPKVEHPI